MASSCFARGLKNTQGSDAHADGATIFKRVPTVCLIHRLRLWFFAAEASCVAPPRFLQGVTAGWCSVLCFVGDATLAGHVFAGSRVGWEPASQTSCAGAPSSLSSTATQVAASPGAAAPPCLGGASSSEQSTAQFLIMVLDVLHGAKQAHARQRMA